MAVNRDPILKKCRALELDPSYPGIYKSSHREPKRSSSTVCSRSSSARTTKRPTESRA